jgi:hypothetical protein
MSPRLTMSATRRFNSESQARYSLTKPPSPMWRWSWKRPTESPGHSCIGYSVPDHGHIAHCLAGDPASCSWSARTSSLRYTKTHCVLPQDSRLCSAGFLAGYSDVPHRRSGELSIAEREGHGVPVGACRAVIIVRRGLCTPASYLVKVERIVWSNHEPLLFASRRQQRVGRPTCKPRSVSKAGRDAIDTH